MFCPYHDDHFWADLKASHPEEFARAVAFDKTIRDMTRTGIKQPVFLHRSLRPLDEIDFCGKVQLPVINNWNNECEGMCGV